MKNKLILVHFVVVVIIIIIIILSAWFLLCDIIISASCSKCNKNCYSRWESIFKQIIRFLTFFRPNEQVMLSWHALTCAPWSLMALTCKPPPVFVGFYARLLILSVIPWVYFRFSKKISLSMCVWFHLTWYSQWLHFLYCQKCPTKMADNTDPRSWKQRQSCRV